MVAKMWTREDRDRFMHRITFGAIFEITGFWVHKDGEYVHDRYHLVFNEDTEMKARFIEFPQINFPILPCGKVAKRILPNPNTYFGNYIFSFCCSYPAVCMFILLRTLLKSYTCALDIVGFVKYCSPVSSDEPERFPQKQFFVVLASAVKENRWWVSVWLLIHIEHMIKLTSLRL